MSQTIRSTVWKTDSIIRAGQSKENAVVFMIRPVKSLGAHVVAADKPDDVEMWRVYSAADQNHWRCLSDHENPSEAFVAVLQDRPYVEFVEIGKWLKLATPAAG